MACRAVHFLARTWCAAQYVAVAGTHGQSARTVDNVPPDSNAGGLAVTGRTVALVRDATRAVTQLLQVGVVRYVLAPAQQPHDPGRTRAYLAAVGSTVGLGPVSPHAGPYRMRRVEDYLFPEVCLSSRPGPLGGGCVE